LGQTIGIYKDRNETKKAWVEIFKEMNNEFENFEDKVKNDYGKLNALKSNNKYYKICIKIDRFVFFDRSDCL